MNLVSARNRAGTLGGLKTAKIVFASVTAKSVRFVSEMAEKVLSGKNRFGPKNNFQQV